MLLTVKYQTLLANISSPFPVAMVPVSMAPATEANHALTEHDFLLCVKKVMPKGNMVIPEPDTGGYGVLCKQEMYVSAQRESLNLLIGMLPELNGFKTFITSFLKQGCGLDHEPLAFLFADQFMGNSKEDLLGRIKLVDRMFKPRKSGTPFAVLAILKSLKIMTPNAFTGLLFMDEQAFAYFSSICYGLLSLQTYQILLDR